MTYFIFFISGAFAFMIGQALLSIVPLYNLWRWAEVNAIKIMIESEVLRLQSVTILKLAYEESGKLEEFEKIEKVLNRKHKQQEEILIELMKKLLPYKTNYNSIKEAANVLIDFSKITQESQDE